MANEQDKLQIEIVLDDGSVKTGFVNIEKQAKKSAGSIEQSLKSVTDSFSTKEFLKNPKDSIIDLADKFKDSSMVILGSAAAIGAAVYSAKKAFDFTVEGERLKQIESQFNFFANKSGLIGEELASAFDKAADGMVDTTDLMQSATFALIELGEGARRLPEVLEIARKSAAVLGGTAKDRFDDMTRAIVNLSAKGLKTAGIILDTDKVFRDYAKTIGVLTSELTVNQKQQALLNATIERGASSFDGVDAGAAKATSAYQRLKIVLNDLSDQTMKKFSDNLSSYFSVTLSSMTDFFSKFKDNSSELDKFIKKNTSEIEALQSEINAINRSLKTTFDAELKDRYTKDIEILSAQILGLKSQQAAEIERVNALKAEKKDSGGGVIGPTADQMKAARDRLNQSLDFVNQIRMSAESSRRELDILSADTFTTESSMLVQRQQMLLSLENEFTSKRNEVQKRFLQEGFANTALQKQAEVLLTQEYESKKAIIELNTNQQRINQMKKFSEDYKAVSNAIVSVASTSLQAIGASLVKGKDAFAGFAQSVLGIVGDLMIQLGTAIIAQSIAIDALAKTIAFMTGGFGIVAGAALIAAGGALKASVGAPSSSVGGGASAGGGIAAEPSPTTELPTQEEVVQQQPNTEVQVVINGSILDSDESGSRIISLINDAFDKKGVVIQRGVMA